MTVTQRTDNLENKNVARPGFARWLGVSNDITRMFLAAGSIPDMINIAGGLPEPATYPMAELAEIAERAISRHPRDTLNYSPIEGLSALRERLARRYSTSVLRLTRENIIITSGGMQALDLLGKVLLDQGSMIAAQSPTYLGALDAWRPRMPTFRPIYPDREDFDALQGLTGAQFAYTVPNFSNPTGRLIGAERRQDLVDASHRTGTWLVEDDPYGTLFYDGEPLPRMISMSGAEQAAGEGPYRGPLIYMGTLSKELAPGFRVGWVIAAPEMIEALTLAKQGSDMCTSGLSQRIALDALDCGLPERTLPTVLDTYRGRRDALCNAITEHLTEWFEWEKPVGGMFVWAVARDPRVDTDLLLQEALKAGVCFTPSSVFDAEGAYRQAVRINFTLNPADRLAEGVKRLATAMKAYMSANIR